MNTADEPLDDLDTFIAEASADPTFKAVYDQARQNRQVFDELRSRRKAAGLSRTVIAGKMGTSEAAVARLESGRTDPRLSSIDRLAAAVGYRLDVQLIPLGPAGQAQSTHVARGKSSA